MIAIPYYGTWAADVALASQDTISSACTLVIGDMTLRGTAYRMASFSGSRTVRIVGGYGGWRKDVPSQSYQNPSGVFLSMVLGDAAKIVGEQLSLSSDVNLGQFYVREAAPAQRLLRQLAGPLWYVDTAGVTKVGARTTGTITSPFQVISWSGSQGKFTIATENYSDWMPGKTFTSTTVTSQQTVSMATFTLENDGKLRLDVLGVGGAT